MLKKVILLISFVVIIESKAQHIYYPTSSLGEYELLRESMTNFRGTQYTNRPLRYKEDTLKQLELIGTLDNSGNSSYLGNDNLQIKRPNKVGGRIYERRMFYNYIGAFYSIKKEDHVLVINPVINFMGGQESATGKTLFQNTRGAEIWGNIGGPLKGVGFYTYFTENQALLPLQYQQLQDSLNFVPNELFFKKFKKQGAVDYFQARGYITFNAAKNYIKFQFGHDKNKIGNGYRSLILNDFAPQYLFFKINSDVGKVHYQNLFTQFTDNGQILGNTLFGKKYAAIHRLSIDVLRNLSFGVNEMVVFDRKDSTQANQFDFNYLNPVIFYRAIESNLGSRDNSMIALDFNWNWRKRYLFYGQFLLDELSLKQLKSNRNWWGNKYGYQIGGRAFNFMKINRLDILAEYNRVRPFTYSHFRTSQSFSHFNQPLAHPLGANFSEVILEIKYKPAYRLFITASIISTKQGKDSSLLGRNYGSNILRDNNTRATSNNAAMFIGNSQNLIIADFSAAYMLKHNLFIDLGINYRKQGKQENRMLTFGLRLNYNQKRNNF